MGTIKRKALGRDYSFDTKTGEVKNSLGRRIASLVVDGMAGVLALYRTGQSYPMMSQDDFVSSEAAPLEALSDRQKAKFAIEQAAIHNL